MTNYLLLSCTIFFAMAVTVSELMSPHKFDEKFVSHLFKYSAAQVIGFVVLAYGMFMTHTTVGYIAAAGLIGVPLTTGAMPNYLGQYQHKIHVIFAGISFISVFFLGLYNNNQYVVAAMFAYPAACLISHLTWKNSVITEKVAVIGSVLVLIAYSLTS